MLRDLWFRQWNILLFKTSRSRNFPGGWKISAFLGRVFDEKLRGLELHSKDVVGTVNCTCIVISWILSVYPFTGRAVVI